MAMIKMNRGFTLIEMVTVLAVSTILLATTIPLGGFWIESAKLSSTKGEMSHGIGKAIATALRNEQALDSASPASALCLSPTNQLSVLQANSSELPNCAASTGTTVWTSSIPENIEVTDNINVLQCLCFNPSGLLTNNSCAACTLEPILEMSIGDHAEVLHVR